MPIGDKVYFSELTGPAAISVDGTNTLLHTFSDNTAQEVWLYASAPTDATVTITSPLSISVDLNVSAGTETALLSGQVLNAAGDLYVNTTSQVWVRGYTKSHTT